MADCRTFKIDDKFGVPDRLIREYLNECEHRLGLIRVTMQQVTSKTAVLLAIAVVKADDYYQEEAKNES
jgi:hypothetical protein